MRPLWSLVLAFVFHALPAHAKEVVLFDGQEAASIIHQDHRTTELAGQLLARDLQALTGRNAVVSKDLAACAKLCVVIGSYDSPLVERIARDAGVSMATLKGQWERYERVLSAPQQTWAELSADRRLRHARRGVGRDRPDARDGRLGLGMVGRRHAAPCRAPGGRWRAPTVRHAIGAIPRHLPQRRRLGPAAVGRQDLRARGRATSARRPMRASSS